MALIKCIECRKKVSEKAETCPKCGAPVGPSIAARKREQRNGNIGCFIVMAGIAALYVFKDHLPEPSPNFTSGEIVSTPEPPRATITIKPAPDSLMTWFRFIDSDGVLIDDAKVRSGDNCLIVAVTNEWHRQPYQERLQVAQIIHRKWVTVSGTTTGPFSLVDIPGNEVGGRGFTGVWGQESK